MNNFTFYSPTFLYLERIRENERRENTLRDLAEARCLSITAGDLL